MTLFGCKNNAEKIGGIIMLSKIRALKEKKGFTLVELIVVLVILAILAALLVPALTGYIDKARKESIVAETRSVVMAAQTVVSEKYGKEMKNVELTDADKAEIKKLSEVPDEASFTVEINNANSAEYNGVVSKVVYTHGKYVCIYDQATSTYTFSK